MARPKLHKREETLKRALKFFWKNGFSGGSTRELGQALEMHPGSIYSDFGSKENLCLEAINLYGQESMAQFQESLSCSDFFAGFANYLARLVSGEGHPCTCFLAKTFSSQLGGEQPLVERARELIAAFRAHLIARIVRAQDEGELKSELDPEAFASLIQTQIMGLRCLADSTPKTSVVTEASKEIVALLKLAGEPGAS